MMLEIPSYAYKLISDKFKYALCCRVFENLCFTHTHIKMTILTLEFSTHVRKDFPLDMHNSFLSLLVLGKCLSTTPYTLKNLSISLPV